MLPFRNYSPGHTFLLSIEYVPNFNWRKSHIRSRANCNDGVLNKLHSKEFNWFKTPSLQFAFVQIPCLVVYNMIRLELPYASPLQPSQEIVCFVSIVLKRDTIKDVKLNSQELLYLKFDFNVLYLAISVDGHNFQSINSGK